MPLLTRKRFILLSPTLVGLLVYAVWCYRQLQTALIFHATSGMDMQPGLDTHATTLALGGGVTFLVLAATSYLFIPAPNRLTRVGWMILVQMALVAIVGSVFAFSFVSGWATRSAL